MKPEEIQEITKVDQRLFHLLLCIFIFPLTILIAFKSLWLLPVFIFASTLSAIAYRKSKYSIRHINFGNKICKLYSTGNTDNIYLQGKCTLELRTCFRYQKYIVSVSNEIKTLTLLETSNYKKAKSLTEILEISTKVKASIGPKLFGLDQPQKIKIQ